MDQETPSEDSAKPTADNPNSVPAPEKNTEDEKKVIFDYMEELQNRLTTKSSLRQENIKAAANRPEESYFSKLDSSIKKNTAFIRKIKNFTEAQKESILKDLETLNLTKYVGEVAAGLVEAKLKMADVPSVVSICSILHRKYAEFAQLLLESWQKALPQKKDEKIANPSKLRVDLRFYADCVSAGIWTPKEALPLLGSTLTTLVAMDKEEHQFAAVLLAFAKFCGEDYAGLIPSHIKELSIRYDVTMPSSDWLPAEKRANVRNLLRDYYQTLSKHLIREHKDLQDYDRQNRRILQTKGELSSERRDKREQLHQAQVKLLNLTQQMADTLGEPMPELPEEVLTKEDDLLVLGSGNEPSLLEGSASSSQMMEGCWEYDDVRQFYEQVPELRLYMPGLHAQRAPSPVIEETPAEEAELDEKLEADKKETKEEVVEDVQPPNLDDDIEEGSNPPSNKILLDSFLTSLPKCVNREMIDGAAVDFVTSLNTRYNRKRLVKCLYGVPRTRLDLLPFYGRLVASLHPYVPDVGTDLCQYLRQEFRYLVRKKDQINIESKIKVVRYIGELVKFRIFSRHEALTCLRTLLLDFSHHSIEMSCHLLETCGRFWLYHADTHQRIKIYLEQLMRKKNVQVHDSRYVTMIENAYYQVLPPEGSALGVPIERPPLHQYLRQLLYRDLSKATLNKVLRQIRKWPWNDKELSQYAIECLTAAWELPYLNIRTLAGLVAELDLFQAHVRIQVVDAVLEDIRLGMEMVLPKFNQRRVSNIRYLGELYNYQMTDSGVLFKVLYSLITFGVSLDPNFASELDPPDHLMRIRLATTLLDTSGVYFNSGSARKRLDYYLIYLQQYYWYKKSLDIWTEENRFPVDIDYAIRDTLTNLRPKTKMFNSYDEAQKAVADLEKELLAKLANVMPGLGLKFPKAPEDDEGRDLATINEEEVAEPEEVDGNVEEEWVDDEGDETRQNLDQDEPSDHQGTLSQSQQFSATQGDFTMELETDAMPTVRVAAKPCPEDEDFMAAFDKMVAENLSERCRDGSIKTQADIPVPMHVKTSIKKKIFSSPGGELGGALAGLQEDGREEDNTIAFVLMTKKNNKPQFKSLAVPIDSDMAFNLKSREQAEKAEKEHVKRLTLDMNERQEEEEHQEQLGSVGAGKPVTVNLNRERKPKYHHPKGAPDADLIFGPKRVR
nr:EOG090X0143 [Triops cancriformis]